MRRVLISSAPSDADLVARLVADIYRRFLQPLEFFRIGDPRLDVAPAPELRRAFAVADVVFVILTPEYLRSDEGSMFLETADVYFERQSYRVIVVLAKAID